MALLVQSRSLKTFTSFCLTCGIHALDSAQLVGLFTRLVLAFICHDEGATQFTHRKTLLRGHWAFRWVSLCSCRAEHG